MAVISRQDILRKIDNGKLKIIPFSKEHVEPASYDCQLGEILAAGQGRVQWTESNDFILESNSWAAISTNEEFELPNDICATYGIRSSLARRGVIAFGGPQIDPGYHGRIYISLYNPTLEPIVLSKNQEIISVVFAELSSPDEDGYTGPYQGQRDFPSQDVEFMMRMRSRNLASVIDNVEMLDTSVKNLASNLETLTADVHEIKQVISDLKPWAKVIGWLLGAAGVSAVGWAVIEILSRLFS